MRISRVYKEMFEAVQHNDLAILMEAAYRIMKMPIAITDTSYTIIGLYPESVTGDEQWDSNKLNQQITPETIVAFQKDKHWTALKQAKGALCIDWGYCKGRPRYSCLIEKNDVLLGSMAFLIGQTPMEAWHLEATNIISKAIAMVLSRDGCEEENALALKKILLKSLLTGGEGSETEFIQMANMAQFPLQDNYILMGIVPRKTSNKLFFNYVETELDRKFAHSLQFRQEDRLYLLTSGQYLKTIETIFSKLMKEISNSGSIAVAVSNLFSSPFDTYRHTKQVDNLIDIIIPIYENKTVFHYEDYIINIAIEFTINNMMGDNLLHPMLEKLMALDEEHKTEYFLTLKTYIQSLYNKNETAKKLNIHRNTLFYRLEKINKITNINIEDFDTANRLLFSLNYLEVKDKKTKS